MAGTLSLEKETVMASDKEGGAHITRRTALGLLARGLAASSVEAALPLAATKKRPPNVVFVLLDDVGYGDLACLGNPVIKTPNIDDLHSRSARFTDFHASPTCSPSRASFMTGRYSNAVGVWHTIDGRNLLRTNARTLAECFKASGYRTANYGKWHLGDNYPCRPQDRGFDDAVVCGGGGIWQAPDYFGNDDVDDNYIHNGQFQKYTGFSTDIFFDLAMDFMRDAKKREQPFFCYLATTAAHEPVWAQEKDQAPYEHVPGLVHAGFYGMIANIDENLGRLMRFLETQHLAEDTILIFSSDNGTDGGEKVFNAGMRGIKASPYDGGHRMPLFIHWPGGGIDRGKDISTLTAHIDLLPTLVDLCGLKCDAIDVDGRSWRPLLYGGASTWPERVIVTDNQRGENLVRWKETAVMTQRWRLVNPTLHGNPQVMELYDMTKDPGQQENVAAQYPDVVAHLKDEYDAWWKKVSAGGEAYVRIAIGSDSENPSRLNCMDWHGYGSDAANNQTQIRQGAMGNGFWALDVAREGRYRFELRRWPREVDLPINATYTDAKPNRDKTPGASIDAKIAMLVVRDHAMTKPVHAGDKYAAFEVQLAKGPASLRTAFYDDVLNDRGAYYVYAERLNAI
jgi:arylsulfatase A-like enzyme